MHIFGSVTNGFLSLSQYGNELVGLPGRSGDLRS